MVAAAIPDVDGLGIVVSQDAYWNYHHVLGHNLAFGLVVATSLAMWSTSRAKAWAMYLLCFHLHLVMDYYGSGPGWPIHYWWPFSRTKYESAYAWDLSSWQNRVAFFLLLGWTVWIGYRQRRTPLETVMPKLDRQLVGFARE
jgi:inner membrane protein